jgi:hypothetical protein
MNRLIILYFALFCAVSEAFSQKNDYIWMPGMGTASTATLGGAPYPWGGMRMDFSTFPPVTTRQSFLPKMRIQSMVSDQEGNLVAYTNGCHIVNNDNQYMENGTTINPGIYHTGQFCDFFYPAWQGAIFTTDPASDSSYYLFHMGMEHLDSFPYFAGQKFYFSKVDATANEGLGKVTDKNHLLLSNGGLATYVSAVKHANGRDWWIVTPKQFINQYYTFLLDPTGPHLINTQTIGDSLNHGSNCCGQAGFSPDGKKYFYSNHEHGLQLLDFDRCTGLFSNPVFIDSTEFNKFGPVGVSISHNNRFLYVSTSRYIFQLDFEAPNLLESKLLLDSIDYIPAPEVGTFNDGMLAPDGKIYLSSLNYIQDLSVIQFPERKGYACKTEQHGYKLPALYGSDFIFNFPRFRQGPVDGSACDSLGLDNFPLSKFRWDFEDTLSPLQVSFTEVADYEPEFWYWSFGDGFGSTEQYPIHTYAAPGIYEVCLVVANVHGADTLCRTLYLGVSGVENPSLVTGIQVAPNPFHDMLGVAISTHLLNAQFRLYNTWGQLVREAPVAIGLNDIDVQGMAPGVYFWEINAKIPGEHLKTRVASGRVAGL